jgi:hypothetical protein
MLFTWISNENKILFHTSCRQKQNVISHEFFNGNEIVFNMSCRRKWNVILYEFPMEMKYYFTRALDKNKLVFHTNFKENWIIISHEF